MAYFHNCVEYYSPGYSLGALLVAFVCGGLLGILLNVLYNSPKPEFPIILVDHPLPTEEQLRRAWHVIIVLLVLLWGTVTALALHHKDSFTHIKTEL